MSAHQLCVFIRLMRFSEISSERERIQRGRGGGGPLSGQSVSEKKCADGAWLGLFFLSSVDRKTDPLVIVLFKSRAPDAERR